MKKLLIFLSSLLVLCSCIAVTASAADTFSLDYAIDLDREVSCLYINSDNQTKILSDEAVIINDVQGFAFTLEMNSFVNTVMDNGKYSNVASVYFPLLLNSTLLDGKDLCYLYLFYPFCLEF